MDTLPTNPMPYTNKDARMMLDFLSNSSGLLGIDMGSSSIKLLELTQNRQTYTVQSYSIVSFAEALHEKHVPRDTIIADAIQQAIRQAGTHSKVAALAIPVAESISKSITVPAGLDEDELWARIEVEADQQLPYSLDELYWDFEVQGLHEGSADHIDILLVASRREYVEDRVAAAERVGLRVKIMDIETYAMENALSLMDTAKDCSGRVCGLVNIGASTSRFNVVVNGKTTYSTELRFGGQYLTEAIQNHYRISYGDALSVKKQADFSDGLTSTLLNDHNNTLSNQLQRTLQSYAVAYPDARLDTLYLCGGGALLTGLDNYLEESLKIPVIPGNPLAKMGLASHIKAEPLMAQAPILCTACGLALRGFDS